MASGAGVVTVEFFGPFRAFGKGTDVAIGGPVGYEGLLALLSSELGPEFDERARRKNTTLIVNNRIAGRKNLEGLLIEPGDRVAFALLLGGG